MAKRKRRSFTTEFKAQAVRLVRESEKTVGTVARELDLTETALRSWVRQAEIDAGRGAPGALTTEKRPGAVVVRLMVTSWRPKRSWKASAVVLARCCWSVQAAAMAASLSAWSWLARENKRLGRAL